MTEDYRPASGRWWRFNEYEIRNGLIRPTESAILQNYDPWNEYEESRQHGAGPDAEPPYQSLFRLAATATLDTRGSLRAESERALAAWCARYGLLGVLLQHCSTLPASPQTVERDPAYEEMRTSLFPDPPGDRAHVWQQGRWITDVAPPDSPDYPEHLARYFPRMGDPGNPAQGVPEPETEAFWFEYAEPVRTFLQQANALRWVTEKLLAIGPRERSSLLDEVHRRSRETYERAEFDYVDLDQAGRAIFSLHAEDQLNLYTSTIAPVLGIGPDGEYHTLWRFRSLVACFSMMILQDLTEGRRVHKCQNDACGTLFLSSRATAAYCCQRCRNTMQKRRQRHPELRAKKGEAQ